MEAHPDIPKGDWLGYTTGEIENPVFLG